MSGRHRRTWASMAGVLAMALLVSACGDDGDDGAEGSAASADDPVTLRFAWWGNDDRRELTENAIAAFEDQHPEIDIEGEFIEWSQYWDRLATQVAAGDAPDIISQEERFLREYASRGALLDLSEYDDVIDTSQLDPLVINGGEVDGGLYGIPTGVNAYVVYADPQAFAEAGVELPDDTTWTWDDYIEIANTISANTGGAVFGTQDYGANEAGFKILARQHGEELYDKDGALAFSPETLALWWEYSLRLRDGGGAPQAALSAEVQELGSPEETLIGTNRAAMAWYWSNTLAALSTAAGRELVLLRPPGESEGERTGSYLKPAQHYSISADTEHPEEAAVFLDFLLNDPAAVDAIGSDRGLPVNLEQRERILGDLTEHQVAEAEFLAEIQDDVVDSPPAPPVGAGEVVDIIKRINVEVLFDRLGPDEAAEQFISEVEAATG
ncbi:carbohydrate ABC transporter substrate-binding protein [Jiangella aurantiaca]|uniref:Carbohydrate ABC transporter substrate-binding protein n=1 Tax=Jiangella aurantiaca TaxID=2530373 RepID=A0A4V2YRK4_9ACTN|nr:ABC transporter substrate-binding protein [Jiangella aurantiaca]TDD66127.1 carbohydrate ABC transporter substrate-binding protein [Jiangella aurantiaca]